MLCVKKYLFCILSARCSLTASLVLFHECIILITERRVADDVTKDSKDYQRFGIFTETSLQGGLRVGCHDFFHIS